MGDPDIDWMADVMVPAGQGAKKPTPIAPGDVVRLKSGGPAMTVIGLTEETPERARCVWLTDAGPGEGTLPLFVLVKVEANDG